MLARLGPAGLCRFGERGVATAGDGGCGPADGGPAGLGATVSCVKLPFDPRGPRGRERGGGAWGWPAGRRRRARAAERREPGWG